MTVSPSPSRSRTLSDAEVKLLWKATEELTTFHSIVRLLLLTGQRRTEIASLQTSWIKDNSITIPATVTKNGREHTFPISKTSTDVLAAARSTSMSLFAARGQTAKPFSGWSKSKADLDERSGLRDWTLHDLRRTFATGLAALGTPIHVTEKLLNHVSGSQAGIVGVYQRHSYAAEMREAIDKWEAHVISTVNTP